MPQPSLDTLDHSQAHSQPHSQPSLDTLDHSQAHFSATAKQDKTKWKPGTRLDDLSNYVWPPYKTMCLHVYMYTCNHFHGNPASHLLITSNQREVRSQ